MGSVWNKTLPLFFLLIGLHRHITKPPLLCTNATFSDTLHSTLNQNFHPDREILWVNNEHPQLPEHLQNFPQNKSNGCNARTFNAEPLKQISRISLELFDLYNAQNEALHSRATREETHRKGYWHRTVHLWLHDPEQGLLWQKRSSNKDTNPDFWDLSIAGHVSAGESLEEALAKEAYEEVGLTLDLNRTNP